MLRIPPMVYLLSFGIQRAKPLCDEGKPLISPGFIRPRRIFGDSKGQSPFVMIVQNGAVAFKGETILTRVLLKERR